MQQNIEQGIPIHNTNQQQGYQQNQLYMNQGFQQQMPQVGQPMMNVQPQQQVVSDNKRHLYTIPTSRMTEKMLCTTCQEVNWTITDYKIGKVTAGLSCVLSFGLFFCSGIGVFFGCLPCCLSDCKDVEHKCQKCGFVLGTKEFGLCDN